MKHQLAVNGKKCDIGLAQVVYIGHIISTQGVAMGKRYLSFFLGHFPNLSNNGKDSLPTAEPTVAQAPH